MTANILLSIPYAQNHIYIALILLTYK